MSARPPEVTQAALICGVTLRTAPAGDHHTYVEVVPDPVRSPRGPEPHRPADLGRGELHHRRDLAGPSPAPHGGAQQLHPPAQGRAVTTHTWETTSPPPTTPTSPPPPPAWHASTTWAIRARRPMSCAPPATRPATSATWSPSWACPGPGRIRRRHRDPHHVPGCARAGQAGNPGRNARHDGRGPRRRPSTPGPGEPRPLRWWLPRTLGLLLFTAAAAYSWWTPDTGLLRSTVSTGVALYLASRLLRNRRP
ncbi:hypothetical protein NKH18_30940 [Streptomyces sp. M10(2022)]